MVRVLGIETSCDETALGIVVEGREIVSNTVASSLARHAPYGGVIPEIAARAHVESLWTVLRATLEEAHLAPEAIDAIAVTQGPGLPGALLIGVAFAKGLALSLDRPLIPVDHLAAHLYAGEMTDPNLEPPYIGLVVSGGHTLLCVSHADHRFELLGETKDDAVGEAFDKVAKLLGLGYPGGPAIDQLSEDAQGEPIPFPRSHNKQPFDFSFSGLKTAVYQYVHHQGISTIPPPAVAARSSSARSAGPFRPAAGGGTMPTGKRVRGASGPSDDAHRTGYQLPVASEGSVGGLSRQQVANIAASFQEAAVDALLTKTLRACHRTNIPRVVVGGGVASNRRLRAHFGERAAALGLTVVFPPPALCVDNGAMVAGLGYRLLQRGRVASLSLTSDPNLCLA